MNEITLIVEEGVYYLTNRNNGQKYDRAVKEAGPNASPKQILAHYDKLGGYIQDGSRQKIEKGGFWIEEKARLDGELRRLRYKTDSELQEIVRNSTDDAHVPSSIYHKARLELEFRHSQPATPKQEEVLKLAPEFHGTGVDLKVLWRKVRTWLRS